MLFWFGAFWKKGWGWRNRRREYVNTAPSWLWHVFKRIENRNRKQKVKQWARSIHQNFRAEVRKFLGGKWIATGPEGLVPFHSQKEFRPHWKGGCWIAVARVRVTRQIRLYQLYYASCFMRWNFTRFINGLFWADCIFLRVKFKDLRTPLSINERIFESLSGNRPFFITAKTFTA